MKILFLSRFNPGNIDVWSGTLFHIYYKLKEKHHVVEMGAEIIGYLKLFTMGNFHNDYFLSTDRYVERLGKLLSERINALKCDLIFFGDLIMLPLDVNIPYIHLTDLTYEQVNIHIKKSDNRDVDTCIRLEKLLYESSFKIIYASEWIKNRVVEIYNIDTNKIHVVEFGANIPAPTNYSIEINTDICRLIFIGKNWEKKGGDKILQAYKQLKKVKTDIYFLLMLPPMTMPKK